MIYIIAVIVLGIVITIYQKNKINYYNKILNEVKNREIGVNTIVYLTENIAKIEYKLNNTTKFKALPYLQEAYVKELEFYKKLSSTDNYRLSSYDSNILFMMLQTKLKSNFVMSFF